MRESRKLSELKTDGGTQSRIGLDPAKVEEYREAIASGDDFPALVAFYDGESYWLADGFHRLAAAKLAGVDVFLVDVRQGTRRDAVLYACGANATHGLPRTPDDKRRAVETLLRDEEWATWSDREIARRCKVSHPFVAKIRVDLNPTGNVTSERTYTDKHGNTATMQTAKIGNGAAAYEDIRSLMHFVSTWIGRKVSGENAIGVLAAMKNDHRHDYWTVLGVDLARAGKVFRKNELQQAVNNTLDSLRSQAVVAQPVLSQPAEPAQETPVPHPFPGSVESPVKQEPDLTDRVLEYALAYKDPFGRETKNIPNPSHTNGTFWRAIANNFHSRGVVNQAALKIAIKQAFARLRNEPEPDTKYWDQFVPDEDQPASEPAPVLNSEQRPARDFGDDPALDVFVTDAHEIARAMSNLHFETRKRVRAHLIRQSNDHEQSADKIASTPSMAVLMPRDDGKFSDYEMHQEAAAFYRLLADLLPI